MHTTMPKGSVLGRSISALLLVLVAAASRPVWARAEVTPQIDLLVEDAMRGASIPGLALAVVRDGRVDLVKGYGIRQVGAHGAVDGSTTFGIGSVTKSFTAAAAALMVDEKRLSWETPLVDAIPALRFSDPWITAHANVRDVAAHRLGIDSPIDQFIGGGLDDSVRAARFVRPSAPFRTFHYSNLGYALLGRTIENASGESWGAVIRNRLFRPLGMVDSQSSELDFIERDKLARCWRCLPPPGTPLGAAALKSRRANAAAPHGVGPGAGATSSGAVKVLPWRSEQTVAPTGLIHSSARDMANWALFHLNKGLVSDQQLISKEQMEEIHSPQISVPKGTRQIPGFDVAGYGMGWYTGRYRGLRASNHGGGRAGFGATVWLFPDQALGVVVLQNLDYRDAPSLDLLALRVADHYLGIKRTAEDERVAIAAAARPGPRSGARSAQCTRQGTYKSSDIANRIGKYRNDILGDVEITAEAEQLAIVFEPGSAAELLASDLRGDVACFRGHEQVPTAVTFLRNTDGKPTGFLMGSREPSTAGSLWFRRVDSATKVNQ